MKVFSKFTGIATIILLANVFSCSNDGSDIVGSGNLVTVSGFVVNIDNATPALNAKVFLLDNEDRFSTTVDGNGLFSMEVPAGSKLLLVVDDADPAFDGPTGDWYKMLNYDPLVQKTVPAGGITNHLIHACPNPQVMGSPTLSGVAVWNNYLTNGDAANGDFFDVTSANDASIIGGGFIQSVNEVFSGIENMTATIDESDYVVAYIRGENYFNADGLPDAAVGPIAFHPASRTKTDASGGFMSFVTARTDEITVRFVDSDASRGLAFDTPHKVPVRPQMVTLLLGGAVDGVANKSPFEVADAAGLFN